MSERNPSTPNPAPAGDAGPERPLRILHLEDDPADALLVRETLATGGIRCEVQRVATQEAFEGALRETVPELILSDFTLPAYDGPSALEHVRQVKADVPFIFISGTIGEDAAIASLRAGATDYVLKDRLARLCPAVKRALREAEERRARATAEAERRHLEERLHQAQKLEVVGQLAGGIAHDFNNLLVVINSYVDLALDRLTADDPLRADLEEVQKAGGRAAALTRQLLAFSRKQVLKPVKLAVNGGVENIEKMLRRLIGEDVALEVVLGPDAGTVLIDPAQFELVLMNLALNARDAMPSGGALRIATAALDLPAAQAGSRGARPGRYAALTVSDTGCGMDAETLGRVFEPFFTTKGPGKGTGLGLSTVYGVVTQSGGHVELESAPGQGTTVHVLLPRVEGEERPAPKAHPAPVAAAAAGGETVLVVEDDEGVRRLAARVLGRAGYRVIVATTAAEALERDLATGVPIQLLLTDVVLPAMGGAEFASRFVARHPGVPVLFMSGYTGKVEPGPGGALPWSRLVQKPFTARELVARVRAALDGDER